MAETRKARLVHRPGQKSLLQVLKTPADVGVDAAAIVAAADRLSAAIAAAASAVGSAMSSAASAAAQDAAATRASLDALAAVVAAKDISVSVAPPAVTFSPQVIAQAGESRVAVESRVQADVKIPPRKAQKATIEIGRAHV